MIEPTRGPRAAVDVDALTAAYRAGRRTPSQVIDCCLAAARDADRQQPSLRAVILHTDELARRAAEASTARWRAGAPLSPLDGVPVLVKDNLDIAGLPTTNGTRMPFPVPGTDARVVERLRAAGAIIVGKANLHEIGAGTSGINPHHGTPRNPWDDRRWCGGSSSGSACAVGAGLVPLAIGTDAGGSVRAPASLVGAVGLKPTFGRVSRLGMSILCDTIDHIGPIAASCLDAARCLLAIAGVERDDEETWDQPPLPGWDQLPALLEAPLAGTRIGWDRRLLHHRLVSPGVAHQIERAARALAAAGATLVDVELSDPDQARMIGLVLLGAEGPSGMEDFLADHRQLLGADLQVLLEIGAHFTARDYLKAQRLRNRIRAHWRQVLDRVDLVLMPAAGCIAGEIHPEALATGELDQATAELCISQTFPSNLTGFPAVAVPCGLVDGLPVGAQLVARPWEELRALAAGTALERAGLMPPLRPRRWYGDRLLA